MKKVLLMIAMISTSYLFASDATSQGAELTKSCAACHGVYFDKAPLGREHHILKDSKKRIVEMIKYFQNPKDDDEMVMKAPVENLTDAQINTIADYIVSGTPASSTEAVALTKSCAACHGVKFDKAPLGREHHIVRDSKARLVEKIKYFQNPKDDDEMVMKAPVEKLTDKQIGIVADYIIGHRQQK